MKLEFRLYYPTEEIIDFLARVNYPHEGWTVEKFRQLAFVCRLQTPDRKRVGFFWYTLVPDTYRIFEGHVAIDPDFHGRWLDRSVSKQVINYARFLDARVLMVFWRDPKPLNQMKFLGWEIEFPFAWKEIGD